MSSPEGSPAEEPVIPRKLQTALRVAGALVCFAFGYAFGFLDENNPVLSRIMGGSALFGFGLLLLIWETSWQRTAYLLTGLVVMLLFGIDVYDVVAGKQKWTQLLEIPVWTLFVVAVWHKRRCAGKTPFDIPRFPP